MAAYAAAVLAPKLAELGHRHPDLRTVVSAKRALPCWSGARPMRREADIAVRLSRPERGDLTGVRIGTMTFRLYADPAYLAETSESDRRFIGNEGPTAGSPQQAALERLVGSQGFAFRADHVGIQASLARAGADIAMLPNFMIGSDDALVPARPDDPPRLREVRLVFHTDMKASAPMRAVIDCLRCDGGATS